MRATILAFLVALAACSSGTTDPGTGPTPDGGAAGTTPDGGDSGTTPDGGPVADACPTEGATETCAGSTDGSCDPGVRTCTNGVWGGCDGRLQPAPGLCDFPNCAGGENPGCECRAGTMKECYSGSTGTLGHGPCVRGFQHCEATATGAKWGACAGEVVPAEDDCSGRQLDCDEKTPACTCTGTETRPCGGVAGGTCVLGTQACAAGHWGACAGEVQPVRGDCAHASCAGGPNPGCECVIGAEEPCYTGLFGTSTTGTCHAGTRTCDTLGRWGACFGQERPNPSCDVDSCTGAALASCR
jgi:hypothetical protein